MERSFIVTESQLRAGHLLAFRDRQPLCMGQDIQEYKPKPIDFDKDLENLVAKILRGESPSVIYQDTIDFKNKHL